MAAAASTLVTAPRTCLASSVP
ncbi:hypothetical protein E2C01_068225 [Portunus trituberculatus]|uniref:Uncharacterized protein n=1 Tax=Portunus trituberculatus TaxID=210409 RepID=A0A5B7HZH0_PORTR|nr:hypothetical protein [Portunus trituberculatus]